MSWFEAKRNAFEDGKALLRADNGELIDALAIPELQALYPGEVYVPNPGGANFVYGKFELAGQWERHGYPGPDCAFCGIGLAPDWTGSISPRLMFDPFRRLPACAGCTLRFMILRVRRVATV